MSVVRDISKSGLHFSLVANESVIVSRLQTLAKQNISWEQLPAPHQHISLNDAMSSNSPNEIVQRTNSNDCKWFLAVKPSLIPNRSVPTARDLAAVIKPKSIVPKVIQGVFIHNHTKSKKRKLSAANQTPIAPPINIHVTKPSKKSGATNPLEYLLDILSSRGYSTDIISVLDTRYAKAPTEKQIKDYDMKLVHAVRNSDLDTLQHMYASGCSMNACNKFSESIVHLAARVGAFHVFEFLAQCIGADGIGISDDYGRMALHDACWTSKPVFEIVSLILSFDREMILMKDKRGFTPLSYAKQETWGDWIQFFDRVTDQFWPMR